MLGVVLGVASLLGAQEVARAAERQAWILFDSTRTGRTQIYALSQYGDLRQLTFRGGSAPRPAPNGRYVLFDSNGSTWIMHADGRHEKLLLRGGAQASWAPDSRRIAYVRAAGGIWVVNRDGSGKHAVTANVADREPRWSPDGRTIALLNGDSLVVVRHGDRTTLATGVGNEFSWSPHGRWIAFLSGSPLAGAHLALVGAGGGPIRPLVDPHDPSSNPVGESSSPPAWSPNGKLIAYAYDGVDMIDVATGRGNWLDVTEPASEVTWAPRDESTLAAVLDGSEIALLDAGGGNGPGGNSLLQENALTMQPFGIVWTTPPAGVRYRKPAPAERFIVASGFELKSKTPIDELAADGMRVAFRSCSEIGSWKPGTTAVSEVLSQRPVCIGTPNGPWGDRFLGVCCLAIAGDTVGYQWQSGGGNLGTSILELASPQASTSIAGCGYAIGPMLGRGPVLVFAAWMRNQFGTCSIGPSVWRLPLPLTPDECTSPTGIAGSSCREITPGPAVPLAVDYTRIVVQRRDDGAIAVLDTDGAELFSIQFAPNTALTARVDGSDLVVLAAGELRDYDATSGALLHSWPAVPGESLRDTAGGLAAYIVNGTLHLLRLRDGADAVVGSATAAQLEDTGLFYAYKGAYPYPGRIRFVPFDQLPLT